MKSGVKQFLDLEESLRCAKWDDEGVTPLLDYMDMVWYDLTDQEREELEEYGILERLKW